jgi:hypothetical protein
MMDAKNMFSDAQAITASAASETVLDFGVANANLGQGSPLIIRFIIEANFTSAASTGTLTIALQHSATDFGGTDVLLQTKAWAIAATTLVKGSYLPEIKIPDRHMRYLRLYYTVGTENFTAGKLTAWIDIGSGEGDS